MADGQQKTYELTVEPRDILGKRTHQLRRQGRIPAVVYGHRVEPTPVQVDSKELERVYLRAGNNSLVDLHVGEGAAAQKVFIHNVQRDPVKHLLSHVDFMVVNLREEITTTVPIVLVGESPAVRAGEGILIHPVDHLQIRTLPTSIPQLLEVDISGLDEVDKAIYVSDIEVPGNVQVLSPAEELVAKVSMVREEPEEVEAAEAAAEEAEESGEAEAEAGEAGEASDEE
jgi:large subunit ribosomal protein L25